MNTRAWTKLECVYKKGNFRRNEKSILTFTILMIWQKHMAHNLKSSHWNCLTWKTLNSYDTWKTDFYLIKYITICNEILGFETKAMKDCQSLSDVHYFRY